MTKIIIITHCEDHLRESIKCNKEIYGSNVEFIFEPLGNSWNYAYPMPNWWKNEKERIFSRAAARFQHLILM